MRGDFVAVSFSFFFRPFRCSRAAREGYRNYREGRELSGGGGGGRFSFLFGFDLRAETGWRGYGRSFSGGRHGSFN